MIFASEPEAREVLNILLLQHYWSSIETFSFFYGRKKLSLRTLQVRHISLAGEVLMGKISLAQWLKKEETKELFIQAAHQDRKAQEKLASQLYEEVAEKSWGFYTRQKRYVLICQSSNDTEGLQIVEELRTEIMCKILEGKIIYNQATSNIRTYINRIIDNSFCKMKKKKEKEKIALAEYAQIKGDECLIAKPASHDDNRNMRCILKDKYYLEINKLELDQRLTVKIWRPYLFSNMKSTDFPIPQLLEDEVNHLKQYNQDISQVQKELGEKISEGNPTIDSKTIANILNSNYQAIDSRLTSIRKRLPWLVKKSDQMPRYVFKDEE